MKKVILSAVLLFSISTHPLLAANCQAGICPVVPVKISDGLQTGASARGEAVKNSMSEVFKKMELSEKRPVRIDNDSKHKGPSSSTGHIADDLAPVRRYMPLRPELVQSPMFSAKYSGNERIA